jgi:hypothetical protein
MKKVEPPAIDELRPEYKRSDFDKLARGKYVERLKKGSNVVVLDPRVARAFPTSEAVNEALLSLVDLAKRSTRSPRRPSGHAKTSR